MEIAAKMVVSQIRLLTVALLYDVSLPHICLSSSSVQSQLMVASSNAIVSLSTSIFPELSYSNTVASHSIPPSSSSSISSNGTWAISCRSSAVSVADCRRSDS
jgi:hypothetical protein